MMPPVPQHCRPQHCSPQFFSNHILYQQRNTPVAARHVTALGAAASSYTDPLSHLASSKSINPASQPAATQWAYGAHNGRCDKSKTSVQISNEHKHTWVSQSVKVCKGHPLVPNHT